MTLDQLREKVKTYLKRPDLDGNIDAYIRTAERGLLRQLRLPIQEKLVTHDTSTDGARVPVPANFLSTKVMLNKIGSPIDIDLNQLFFSRNLAQQSQYSTNATRVGSEMYLWPSAPEEIKWLYFAELSSVLDDTTSEDYLLDVAFEAWASAAALEGAVDTRNQSLIDLHGQRFEYELSKINEQHHLDTYGGTSIPGYSEYAV